MQSGYAWTKKYPGFNRSQYHTLYRKNGYYLCDSSTNDCHQSVQYGQYRQIIRGDMLRNLLFGNEKTV